MFICFSFKQNPNAQKAGKKPGGEKLTCRLLEKKGKKMACRGIFGKETEDLTRNKENCHMLGLRVVHKLRPVNSE